MDTKLPPMLTPTELLEHVWCPRFTWFMQVQHIAQHEDKRYKVQKGRAVHERRERENKDYARRKLDVVKKESAVYLGSPALRLRGIVDEVLWLRDGGMAPLDYKYTQPGEHEQAFKTHRVQVSVYALLIEEIYRRPVRKAFVAYIRGGSKVFEVDINEGTKEEITCLVDEIFAIIRTGRLPKRTPQRVKCADCCYKNICV